MECACSVKILYPTDFSEPSKKAIRYVKKLREAGTKEIIILHVIDEHELLMRCSELSISC